VCWPQNLLPIGHRPLRKFGPHWHGSRIHSSCRGFTSGLPSDMEFLNITCFNRCSVIRGRDVEPLLGANRVVAERSTLP
jgi:hypothetical protein